MSAFAAAQTPVTFAHVTSTSGETPANIYAVDVNNDGLSDIIQDTAQSPSAFSVSLNQGNGSFGTPTVYKLPVSYSVPSPVATGDFNNDGKVDIAVVLLGTNQIALYLGNGDGSFQAPILNTIALPSGWVFEIEGAVAADFNGDGCDDLAAWTSSNQPTDDPATTAVYTLEGNCAGGFENPQQALVGPSYEPGFQLLAGDFDSDGHADLLATTYTLDPGEGYVTNTTAWVLYGNGNFGFDNTSAYSSSSPSPFLAGTGDLNSDGRTDFFVISDVDPGPPQIGVFYGNTNRTFSSYFQNTDSSYSTGDHSDGVGFISLLTLADFNGDGLMDLTANGFNSETYTEFYLATSDPGQFTQQNLALPVSYTYETAPVVGLFSGSYLLPDVVLNQSNNGGDPPQNSPSFLTTDINQASSGWFGNCTYPKSGEGFNVCNPGVADSSQNLFSANVNSFGKLRKIELWVDGVKVQEQHHTWDQHGYFDWAGTFAAGTHQATFYAADVDNRLQSYSFTFTTGSGSGGSGGSGSCPVPSSPSVNVCSPANNSTVSSPVQATATANIGGETLDRMEIWVDGAKQYTETTSTSLNISLPLNPGTHKIDFYAVSTSGGEWETTSYATVPASGSTGSTQYEAPVVNYSQGGVAGQIQIDTVGNTSIQLGDAPSNTTYTVQFCAAYTTLQHPNGGIPCFNVTTITTNSNGIAAATVKFPQAGNWAGDFYVNDSSGNRVFWTTLSFDGVNQNYFGTLLPQTKTDNGEVTTVQNQDPLTNGTVTVGNNQVTFTVNGAEPNTTYDGVESEGISVASSGSYEIADLTTDASGNGSTTVSMVNNGAGGDMFQLIPQSNKYAGFIAGFTIP